jgi:hypothetical protein
MLVVAFCFASVLFTVTFILSGEGLDVGNLEDPSLPAALFCAFAAFAMFGVGSFDKLENWRKKDGD